MGKIVVSEFTSLDGIVEDPSGAEGFDRGGWVGVIDGQHEVDAIKLAEARSADALLLGRRTYEFFASRWPARSGELADAMNALPKHVVSDTLTELGWRNSTVLDSTVLDGRLGNSAHGVVTRWPG